jgi:hypothetical protein
MITPSHPSAHVRRQERTPLPTRWVLSVCVMAMVLASAYAVSLPYHALVAAPMPCYQTGC